MTYFDMANDLQRFVEKVVVDQHSVTSVTLMGHSMGGKAAMCMALSKVKTNVLVLQKVCTFDHYNSNKTTAESDRKAHCGRHLSEHQSVARQYHIVFGEDGIDRHRQPRLEHIYGPKASG